MKKRTWVLLAAGAPAVGGCLCYSPTRVTLGWNGLNGDGTVWDGGAIQDCRSVCIDAGAYAEVCEPAGPGLVECFVPYKGRAPPGLVGLAPLGDTAGSALAASAEFEAAAVHAFWQLADELEAHGLPGDSAREAAFDEVRHAHDTTKLALSMGYLPAAPRIARLREPRSLEDIAIDNAAEGCGREVFGALENAWQAEHATDVRVRALMREVTPDEQGHAAFSMDLAEKLGPRLSLAARRRMREAQERALTQFGGNVVPEAVRRQLGLMDAEQAKKTVRRLLDTARLS